MSELAARMAGKSGLRMSALSLGTMTFGHRSNFGDICATGDDANRMVAMALDHGVDTFDTANAYGMGTSEEILGRALASRRTQVTVCTKCRFSAGRNGSTGYPRDHGLSRSAIINACEDSLRRLNTDYIDVVFFHMQDRSVPIEETLRAADTLVRSGKVRYLGCSNYTGYRTVEALWVADRMDLARPTVLQLPWSPIQRDAERELVPAALEFGLGVMVYSPLARGFLAAKYEKGKPAAAGTRLACWPDQYQEYDQERNWQTKEVLNRIAAEMGEPPSVVALAFLLQKPWVTSVVIGARRPAQLEENLRAASLRLPRSVIDELDRVSTPTSWGYPYDFIGRFEPW